MLEWIIGIVVVLIVLKLFEYFDLFDIFDLFAGVARLMVGAIALLGASLLWLARKIAGSKGAATSAQPETRPAWRGKTEIRPMPRGRGAGCPPN